MKSKIIKSLLISSAILFVYVGLASATGLTGAIFTTESSCTGVNVNIFDAKSDVYIDGGPHHEGSAGLPDGYYFVQVTIPSGALQLGYTDTASVHVTDGGFDICYQLTSILKKTSDSTAGFDDTTNKGGVYKAWVCQDAEFTKCKTDNFKVKNDDGGTEELPNPGSISGTKWEDLNADAVFDNNEFGIENWTIELWNSDHTLLLDTTSTDSNGGYIFGAVPAGTYQVCEVAELDWIRSFPLASDCHSLVLVTENTDTPDIDFGNYQKANLTVIKHVINDNNGPAVAGEFTMDVSGTDVSDSSFPGDEAGVTVTLKPGAFSVTESGIPVGYLQTTPDLDCSGTATSGQSIVCTITNDDVQPLLTVTKVVVNSFGGLLSSTDFPLFVNATSVTTEVQQGFNAGNYTISETQQSGYLLTGITGDCAGDGTITLAVGDVKSCTLTNHDIQPQLIVIKHVVNNNTGSKTASNFTMLTTGINISSTSFPGAESPGTTLTLNAGAYTVNENNDPAYTKTLSADCSGVIAIGEVKTCTITNDDLPPTRTQGFWQTHLTLSDSVWGSVSALDKDVCSKVGVTSSILPNTSQLMGGFWSSISQKTGGSKRTALDQAKMQMLQQYFAAVLNKAAFGTSDGGLLALARAACLSNNKTTILNAAGLLGAFNQSGDFAPILLNPGSANSTAAQTSAFKSFWNTP